MKVHRTILTTLCWFCAFSFAIATRATETNQPATKFAWQPPLKFKVEETITKNDDTIKVLHTFSFTETNGEMVLKWLDVKFLSLNGKTVTPAIENYIRPARAAFLSNPPMRISRKGEFLGTLHTQESVEEINKLLDKAFPGRPEDVRKFYSNLAQSPARQAMVDAAVANRYWSPWVEIWQGLVIQPGQSVTNQESLPLGSFQIPCTNIFSRLTSDNPKEARYTLNQIAGGTNFGPALAAFFKSLAQASAAKSNKPFPEIESATIRRSYETQTNPDTLQPSRAKCVIQMKLVAGDETSLVKESYEYKFFWNTE